LFFIDKFKKLYTFNYDYVENLIIFVKKLEIKKLKYRNYRDNYNFYIKLLK